MNIVFIILSSILVTLGLLIFSFIPLCFRCWIPYLPVFIFALGVSLISPSVCPSLPLAAPKNQLSLAFNLYRAFGAVSTGGFVLAFGIVQEKTLDVREGYYWVFYID